MASVIIASKNSVKIAAVKAAFTRVFSDQIFDFQGVSVPSGVADQPMTSDETYLGAVNRARNAQENMPSAEYWVGIEGGVELQDQSDQSDPSLLCFAWIVIVSKDHMTKAQTSVFELPTKVSKLVQGGMELGAADDLVFGKSNSKQETGAVGLLTKDLITRTSYYTEATILALIPFMNTEYY